MQGIVDAGVTWQHLAIPPADNSTEIYVGRKGQACSASAGRCGLALPSSARQSPLPLYDARGLRAIRVVLTGEPVFGR